MDHKAPELEAAARQLAEVIHAESAAAIHLASEETKALAQRMYLDIVEHDIEIVFNATEWRDAQKRGQSAQQFLDMLLFAEAEPVIEPLIEAALQRMGRDFALGEAVDRAIDEAKERSALLRGAA